MTKDTTKDDRPEPVAKKTSIGNSVRSRPSSKQDKKSFKRYKGQGK